MTSSRSPVLSLRCRGPLAVFSRPELKAERMTYAVITPSAARGILEAVLWKPAIRWRVERIRVLSGIQYVAFRRNEVNNKAVAPSAAVIQSGGPPPTYFADEDRAQRNTVALRCVDYVIDARFEMTERAGEAGNVTKFVDMFQRRVEKGQCFQTPYFGCREFPADFMPVGSDCPTPIARTHDLGIMLWDIEFGKKKRAGVLSRPAGGWRGAGSCRRRGGSGHAGRGARINSPARRGFEIIPAYGHHCGLRE